MASSAELNRLKEFVWASDRRPMSKEAVIYGMDSLSQAKTLPPPLSDLRKFSGAQAALAAYAPFDHAAEQDSLRADSIQKARKPLTEMEYRARYQYVLQPKKEEDPTSPPPLINTSWVYKAFSNKEDQDSSSTSSSIGILERKN